MEKVTRIIVYVLVIGATFFLSPILAKLQYSLFIGYPDFAPWFGVAFFIVSMLNVFPIIVTTFILYFLVSWFFRKSLPSKYELVVFLVIYTFTLFLLTNPLINPLLGD